jgi:hypothetical protein
VRLGGDLPGGMSIGDRGPLDSDLFGPGGNSSSGVAITGDGISIGETLRRGRGGMGVAVSPSLLSASSTTESPSEGILGCDMAAFPCGVEASDDFGCCVDRPATEWSPIFPRSRDLLPGKGGSHGFLAGSSCVSVWPSRALDSGFDLAQAQCALWLEPCSEPTLRLDPRNARFEGVDEEVFGRRALALSVKMGTSIRRHDSIRMSM